MDLTFRSMSHDRSHDIVSFSSNAGTIRIQVLAHEDITILPKTVSKIRTNILLDSVDEIKRIMTHPALLKKNLWLINELENISEAVEDQFSISFHVANVLEEAVHIKKLDFIGFMIFAYERHKEDLRIYYKNDEGRIV